MVRGFLSCGWRLPRSAPLAAAPLSVRVVDASGQPVRDAVVTLYPAAGAARPATPAAATSCRRRTCSSIRS